MNIVGNVKNKNCVIVDDIIDSGGTIVNAAQSLKDKGAKDVYVYITHAVLSGEAINKIEKSQIKKLITTNTIDNSKKIRRINSSIAIIDKRRPSPGKSEVMNIVGNVKNKNCVIVDDIIDSGGTIVNAVKALKEKGAKDVYVYITHAVLSGEAVNKIEKSQIKKLMTTDTIDNSKKIKGSKKIEIISIAPMISEAMKRIANSTSVSSLFK